MSEILLIHPPQTRSLLTTRREWTDSSYLPLGLAYLGAMLEQDGYDVQGVDMMVEEMRAETLKKVLRQAAPKVVGITSTIRLYNNGLRVAKLVKEMFPETVVIIGGPHVSYIYEEALSNENIDIVALFEAEETMVELAGHLLRGEPKELSQIQGIAYRQGDETIVTPQRPFLQDLDSVPFPARHLFPLDRYPRGVNMASILVGRGCPFKCIFCSANTLTGLTYRMRSADNVLEEITDLLGRREIDRFYIVDDTFTISRRGVIEVCKALIEEKVDATWQCGARANTVNDELLGLMYEAGCRTVQYGAESGDDKVLKTIEKGVNSAQIEAGVAAAVRSGINVDLSFVIGHPADTHETIRTTIGFARRLIQEYSSTNGGPRVWPKFTILTPLPGTPVYDHADELGVKILTKNWDRYSFHTPLIETRNLDRKDLATLYSEAVSISVDVASHRKNLDQGGESVDAPLCAGAV